MLFSKAKNPFPNYGSLELPEQLSDRVIFFAEFLPRPLYAVAPRFSPQMSDKIAFDTNSPEPTRARADFTYKTTSPVISMVDTGLGKFSVTEDIKAVLRKIEYRRQGSTATFKIMCREVKDSGTEFSGMAKTHPFWLCRKPTSEKLARNYWPKLKTSERALAPPDPASFLRRSGLVLDRTPARANLKSGASRPLDDFYDVFASKSSGHARILVDASTVWL